MIRTFKLDNNPVSHTFFVTKHCAHKTGCILSDQRSGTVAVLHTKYILKLVKGRSWHEYVRLLWGRSRLSKEVKGNSLMVRAGLRVPQLAEIGITVMPWKKDSYLGYYCMEDMTDSGYCELENWLKQPGRTTGEIAAIIHAIASDIKKLMQKKLVYTDINKRNIYINSDHEIAWIDTGISKYHFFTVAKFRKHHNKSLSKFIQLNKDIHLTEQQLWPLTDILL